MKKKLVLSLLAASLCVAHAQSGYKGFVEGGFTAGLGNWNLHRVEVLTSHGYEFSPYFFAGAGTGFQYYTLPESFMIPIYADFRSTLLPGRKISPTVGLKLGYTLDVMDGVAGMGLFASPTVGVRCAVRSRNAVRFELGYAVQQEEASVSIPWLGTFVEHVNMNGLAIRIGYEF